MVLGPHYCYIVANSDKDFYTYNGYTNNIVRRLKQHCGILKGGAKYTTRKGPNWNYIAIIECTTSSYNDSLSFEWSIRFPTSRKPRPKEYNKPEGRIKSLYKVFTNPKFTDKNYIAYIKSEYIESLKQQCNEFKNVEIKPLEPFLEALNQPIKSSQIVNIPHNPISSLDCLESLNGVVGEVPQNELQQKSDRALQCNDTHAKESLSS